MYETAKALRVFARIKQAILASVIYLVASGVFSVAEGAGPIGQPIYNPHTKSYFQVIVASAGWDQAQNLARTSYHKGVSGRLAHVEDLETHEFLVSALKLKEIKSSIWIGLRYWCGLKMLQWTSDRAYSPSDSGHFKMWHTKWTSERGEATCGQAQGGSGFYGVFYRTINGVTRWRAVHGQKVFYHYIVEYPTGGE